MATPRHRPLRHDHPLTHQENPNQLLALAESIPSPSGLLLLTLTSDQRPGQYL